MDGTRRKTRAVDARTPGACMVRVPCADAGSTVLLKGNDNGKGSLKASNPFASKLASKDGHAGAAIDSDSRGSFHAHPLKGAVSKGVVRFMRAV